MSILVIGGTSGIGKEYVDHVKGMEDVVAPPQKEFDVTNIYQMRDFLAVHDKFDRVVFSAGTNVLGALGTELIDDLHHIVDVNMNGFILLMDELVLRNGREWRTSVVAVVSDSAYTPRRTSIAYCASKAGLAMAVRVAARELAPHWRVNGVNPGVVADTPMSDYIDRMVQEARGWTAEEASKYELATIPMGRRADKKEVARAIDWALHGPEYLTGSFIDVTGGK